MIRLFKFLHWLVIGYPRAAQKYRAFLIEKERRRAAFATIDPLKNWRAHERAWREYGLLVLSHETEEPRRFPALAHWLAILRHRLAVRRERRSCKRRQLRRAKESKRLEARRLERRRALDKRYPPKAFAFIETKPGDEPRVRLELAKKQAP